MRDEGATEGGRGKGSHKFSALHLTHPAQTFYDGKGRGEQGRDMGWGHEAHVTLPSPSTVRKEGAEKGNEIKFFTPLLKTLRPVLPR